MTVSHEEAKKRQEAAERIIELATDLLAGERDTLPDSHAAKLAADFCRMSDDGQAQFFTHVARVFNSWDRPWWQVHAITRHMQSDCTCVGPEGVRFVLELAEGLQV